jgi:cytoskeletal protein CcmA (bactofilin family)
LEIRIKEKSVSELSIQSVDESDIDTILAEDIDFTGKLTFTEPLMIKGKFNGEIESSSDLYIGENAVVNAEIEAKLVSLKGKVKGNIKANKKIELFNTAQAEGDITTPSMVMEGGCKLNGLCVMNENGEGGKE